MTPHRRVASLFSWPRVARWFLRQTAGQRSQRETRGLSPPDSSLAARVASRCLLARLSCDACFVMLSDCSSGAAALAIMSRSLARSRLATRRTCGSSGSSQLILAPVVRPDLQGLRVVAVDAALREFFGDTCSAPQETRLRGIVLSSSTLVPPSVSVSPYPCLPCAVARA